jgi:hypothetical protein
MMQVDVLSHRIPNFVKKARRAGCTQVFIGMESLNRANLKGAGKMQNRVSDYVTLIRAWQEAEVATHVGYILGFAHDTSESVRRDLQTLMNEIRVEQASFFILTPLPGSRDHLEMVKRGEVLDSDFNKYDSMYEAMNFPNFPRPGSLKQLYDEAYDTFYDFDNMKRILLGASARNYWNIFRNFIWYKHAAILERRHPMMAGFIRCRSRQAMRKGVPVPGRWDFFKMCLREFIAYARGGVTLLWEMQELWLQTRPRNAIEQAVVDEMRRTYARVQRRLTVSELQYAYQRARTCFPALKVPSRLALYWQQWNPFCAGWPMFTRHDIDRSWRSIINALRQYRFWAASPFRLITTSWLDLQITTMFFLAFFSGSRRQTNTCNCQRLPVTRS